MQSRPLDATSNHASATTKYPPFERAIHQLAGHEVLDELDRHIEGARGTR
jgi:hypothetical protein